MSSSTAAHRDDSRRKSRAVRLGAILLAVVGVTAAATSAGFSNDAWFSANASSASVALDGSLDGQNWEAADTNGVASLEIPSTVFDKIVPNDTRTETVYIKNSGTSDLSVKATLDAKGQLLTDSKTTVSVAITGADTDGSIELKPGEQTKAVVTVAAGDWDQSLADQKAADNTLTVDFTGTTVVADSSN